MYVSFVLVIFKFIRSAFIEGRMMYVPYEELPNIDCLLMLFDQMQMAREMKDYWVEEELVAKIIFIFRTPDILFRITRLDLDIKPQPEKSKSHLALLSKFYEEMHNRSRWKPTKLSKFL
ncbi:piezo-type mechanosensitive ion channel component [Plakobranchus ocellatus]|uniref:Piezo-type mechanosensitive ion channel component n=1 Tax=Plakobranchus ocellatus TaxID=259542 RepID=A0AAV4CI43_9GAST|nr:piezo-type mechanosensitive ion channel component [Plakobranchus ocellatus]